MPEVPHSENNQFNFKPEKPEYRTLTQPQTDALTLTRSNTHVVFFFLLLHFHALRLESPLLEGRCSAAKRQAGHRGAHQQEALLAVLTNQTGPPPQEVTEQRLLLDEGAEGQQDVEDLMTLTNDVTATRKETLRNRTREERGQQN